MQSFQTKVWPAAIVLAVIGNIPLDVEPAVAAPIRTPHDRPSIRTTRISGCDYELPDWWDTVIVTGKEEIYEFKCSPDPNEWLDRMKEWGMKEKERTPREHLKIRALAWHDRKDLPVYLANYHMEAQEYHKAARIYADLYLLAETHGDSKDWYHCYLAHKTGRCFFYIRDYESAAMWHRRAAAFVGHKVQAISHYAELSADMIETCDRSAAIVRARRK